MIFGADLTWYLLGFIGLISLFFLFFQSPAENPDLRQNNAQNMGGVTSTLSRAIKKKKKKDKKVLAAISSDARSLGAKLGVEPRGIVTFYSKNGAGEVMADVLRSEVFKLIFEYAEVHVITWVESDEEEQAAMQIFEDCGLVGDETSFKTQPRHKFLFCSSEIGKRAFLRQLKPQLHIDTDESTLEDMSRFLPQLIQIGGTGDNGGKWRCVSSLSELN
mmetsp:Transcript_17191/g.22664  ORF Transcript_17191/g.22664 Transcript_17191/m.22664 type:complete len:218 (-) Transcript_17191:412-1065(-)